MAIKGVLSTSLHALGEPVPSEMTRVVKNNILQMKQEIAFCNAASVPKPLTRNSDVERNTEEHSESLGYI